jgi:hypothetical protein
LASLSTWTWQFKSPAVARDSDYDATRQKSSMDILIAMEGP